MLSSQSSHIITTCKLQGIRRCGSVLYMISKKLPKRRGSNGDLGWNDSPKQLFKYTVVILISSRTYFDNHFMIKTQISRVVASTLSISLYCPRKSNRPQQYETITA